jgi:hypothetical protein
MLQTLTYRPPMPPLPRRRFHSRRRTTQRSRSCQKRDGQAFRTERLRHGRFNQTVARPLLPEQRELLQLLADREAR